MRKLAWFFGSFAGGIFLAQYLLPRDWQLRLCPVWFLLAAGGLLLRGRPRLRLMLLSVGVGAGLAWNWCYGTLVQSPAEELAGTERAQASMTLMDYPEPARYGARAVVRLETPGERPVLAVYYGEEALLDLVPGNLVTGDIALGSAGRIREKDVTTFTSRGIFLLAYRRGEITASEGSAGSPRWWPLVLGRALRTRLQTLLGGDEAAFLTAILTGDESGLSTEAYTALSEAGLLHILAVSGMHCAFLLSMVTALTGRQRRRLTAAAAIPLLLFYMVLTGCSPSVVRACVMLISLLAAPLFRRDSDGPTSMTAALFVILLQNPFAAASVSLQLSFGAVAGILWLTPKLTRGLLRQHNRNRVLGFLAVTFSTTLGALLFTAPLAAVYFGSLVLLAPVSSLLCLPAASVIFSAGLLSGILSFLWMPLGKLVGLLPLVLIRYVMGVAGVLADIPYHAVYFANPYLKYWLIFAYLLFFLAWRLQSDSRRKYLLSAVLAAVTLTATVWLGARRNTSGRLNITVLDVGQGQCVALSSGGQFALLDCGSGNSWYDAGDIAADTLQTMGCFRLDYLLLTHFDADHVSGVAELLARMPVDTLLAPETEDDSGLREQVLEAAEAHGVRTEVINEQTSRGLGEALLTVYPPVGKSGDNEQGLACLATAGEYDLLVTGDMSAATEKRLLAEYRLPDIEALVVGHHGAGGSTSRELLEAVRPETAVISVGDNAYGHPDNQTLRRLLRSGAEIFRTDLQGTIHITVN